MSEETDAVIVVVSEETGAVSYAYRGELVRGVTIESLRAFLTSVLIKNTRPRKATESIPQSSTASSNSGGTAIVTKPEPRQP